MLNECRVCQQKNTLQLYEMSLTRDNDLCSIYICNNCLVLYNSALDEKDLSINEFEDIQGHVVQEYYAPTVRETEALRLDVEKSQGILDFLFTNPGLGIETDTFIDIGAGAGMLAAAASSRFKKVYASDLDTSLVSKTVEALALKNVIVAGDFQTINDKFDVAVLWHTLEHVHDPKDFVLNIKKKLNKNGAIFCQVPLYRKEYFVDGHLWFFNAATIEKMKEMYGFNNVLISFDPHNNYLTFCFTHPIF